MSVKWQLHKWEFTELSRRTSIASKSSGWSPVKSLTSWSIWNIKSNTNTEKEWSEFHPGGPQVAAPIDLDIAISQQRSFCVFFRPLHFNHKISYVVDDFKIQFENLSRTGQKKKEMKMGKSNYWTIWCPISQIVEHFDFLAYFPNSPFSSYKIKSEILKAWKQVSIKHKGIN